MLAAGAAAVVVGLIGGYVVHELVVTDRTIDDASGTISVTVPEAWTRAVDTEQWVPPDAEADAGGDLGGHRVRLERELRPGAGRVPRRAPRRGAAGRPCRSTPSARSRGPR